MGRLGSGISRKIVADVFVLGGQDAVVAIDALGHIDPERPLLHDAARIG
jgi:hypothetical protein